MRKPETKAEERISLEELAKLMKKESNVRVYQRLLAIRLSLLDHPVSQIAEILGVHPDSVYEWIALWNEGGYDALKPEFSGGRPSKLSEEQKNELRKVINIKNPCEVMDINDECWDIKLVQRFIIENLGVSIDYGYTWTLVRKEFGLHYLKPYSFDYRRPENAEDILKERIEAIKLKIESGEYTIGFLDEACAQNKPALKRILTSLTKAIVKTSYNPKEKLPVFCFMDTAGKVVKKISSKSKKEQFIEFLKHLKDIYGKMIIFLDSARIHIAKKVKKWCTSNGIILVYLPPYSPDLNPVEQLFRALKKHLKNKVFKGIEEIKAAGEKFFAMIESGASLCKGWVEQFL